MTSRTRDSQISDRLRQHRDRFIADGYVGPLLQLSELTGEEIALVNETFFEKVREQAPETLDEMYEVYNSTLHDWGIMCPHPFDGRKYHSSGRWYVCSLCKASVIGW